MIETLERQMTQESVTEVSKWLTEAARLSGLSEKFHATYVRTDNDYLYFAANLTSSSDPFERAKVLQQLENEWEAQHPNSFWRLLLIPSAG